jgi:hypothetical protein
MARAGALISRGTDVALLLMLSPWWLLVFCANPASSAPDSEGSPRKAPNIQPRVKRKQLTFFGLNIPSIASLLACKTRKRKKA